MKDNVCLLIVTVNNHGIKKMKVNKLLLSGKILCTYLIETSSFHTSKFHTGIGLHDPSTPKKQKSLKKLIRLYELLFI